MNHDRKDKEGLSGRVRPSWFDDEKFGIFIHWGTYSVPAYAPVGKADIAGLFRAGDVAEVFRTTPYAEWYLNSIRIPNSPAAEHHKKTYGASYQYEQFAATFNDHISEWDPNDWARLFKQAGAGYVTLVTKHHDGFLLWPSKHPNPNAPHYHASRNIVGELTEAVRNEGMRMNYYYSSLLDWTFTEEPIQDFVDLHTLSPTSQAYVSYQEAHWRELIADFQPSVLWSDIGYPPGSDLLQLFVDYYNSVPEGLVNDRWNQVDEVRRREMKLPEERENLNRAAAQAFADGNTPPMIPTHYDFTTPEYASLDHITEAKWEANRGIGRSFAYNRFEPEEFYLTLPNLVTSFIDIISKNGNLLLNVGPTSTGEIPAIQRNLLQGFGAWMAANRSAVHASRPWKRFGYDNEAGPKVRFTRTGNDLNIFLFPRGATEMTISGISVSSKAQPIELASGRPAAFETTPSGVRFRGLQECDAGTCTIVIPGGA